MSKRKLEIREQTRIRTKKYREMQILRAEIKRDITDFSDSNCNEGNMKWN